ncbi:MAG: TlpA family protein disulfide reductase [Syntrophaceae bacterium]|nr:TlpA family protein disulfide reductase [Syntrophaceae bacterium]
MFEKRRLLKIIALAIVLIAIGFSAGFYSHVPIRKRIVQFKKNRNYKVEQQYLNEKYLNNEASDFTTKTIDDEKWTLHSQRDKVVLLFFWATTCRYCQRAIPDLKEIYKKYNDRDDFIIAGVSLDKDRDMLSCFCSIKEIPWTILYEDGKGWDNSVSRMFEIHRIPSVWIIDKSGIIKGFHMTMEEIEVALSSLLKGEEIDTTELKAFKVKETAPGCPE